MKKVLCTVLALAMALTLLAGCGGAPASSGSTAASGSAGDAAGTTIKVAAIETAYGSEMWQQVAAAFEEETGIKVELTTDKNLEDVIGPGMKAGDYPDVIHLATGREDALTETFIKDNALADITDVLSMTVPGEEVTVACSTTPACLKKRAGSCPPHGTRCGSWATRPRPRASACSPIPPPAISTRSSMP